MSKVKFKSFSDDIQVGEKVQLGLEDNHAYPTLLEDILEDGHLIVSSPFFRGMVVPINLDQNVQFFFFRENGRFTIPTVVDEVFMHKEVRMLSLRPLSGPVKQQRRESFRLPVNLNAHIRPFDEAAANEDIKSLDTDADWEMTTTNNLSESGVSIRCYKEFNLEDMIHIRLQIENGGSQDNLDLLGVVRQVEKVEGRKENSYRLGIEFLPYEERIRRNIAKFILKKQQIILKMKRNEEDY